LQRSFLAAEATAKRSSVTRDLEEASPLRGARDCNVTTAIRAASIREGVDAFQFMGRRNLERTLNPSADVVRSEQE
jgi:hypothetical protein